MQLLAVYVFIVQRALRYSVMQPVLVYKNVGKECGDFVTVVFVVVILILLRMVQTCQSRRFRWFWRTRG